MTSAYPPVPPTTAPVAAERKGVGAARHLISVVLALVTVPAAYVGIDYATFHGLNRGLEAFRNGAPEAQALLPFLAGVVLLLVASASGRLSGLGPLVAGVVWGVLPGLWILLAPTSMARTIAKLPDVYDAFGLGILGAGVVLFPALAALLVGCAISGRWR